MPLKSIASDDVTFVRFTIRTLGRVSWPRRAASSSIDNATFCLAVLGVQTTSVVDVERELRKRNPVSVGSTWSPGMLLRIRHLRMNLFMRTSDGVSSTDMAPFISCEARNVARKVHGAKKKEVLPSASQSGSARPQIAKENRVWSLAINLAGTTILPV